MTDEQLLEFAKNYRCSHPGLAPWVDITEEHFVNVARAIEQASRTAALEEAIENIHALRASHIVDAPTCDYVSCDFVSAWDDAVAAVRALAKGVSE